MDTVNFNGEEYVKASIAAKPIEGLRYCIIRCSGAGVHAGFITRKEGNEVDLVKSRRLWRWYGKTLSGLAIDGSFAPDQCKYADEIPEITLRDWCEIIPCSETGIKSIREDVGPWVND